MNIKRVGIDLAKNVFQVCAVNAHNKPLFNKRLRRSQFVAFMQQLPASDLYMEACYSAHYWGRTLTAMGHRVFLIPAQHVTPFVRGNKNDGNDALAITEAAQRPNLRFVPIKTIAQQEVLALHRLRQRLVRNRLQLSNQARGLLSEFGYVFPQGKKAFLQAMRELPEQIGLSSYFRDIMMTTLEEYRQLSERITVIEVALQQFVDDNSNCQILASIPGVGLINASAMAASIDSGQAFKNGRELGVWLGLAPKHYASGNTIKFGRISKHGDRYLRTQLVQAGHAFLRWARKRDDQLSRWAKALVIRLGKQKAVVAIAHKLARLMWVLLNKQQYFTPQ